MFTVHTIIPSRMYVFFYTLKILHFFVHNRRERRYMRYTGVRGTGAQINRISTMAQSD